MATPFNQGAPTIPVVLNTSNCFVFGNTASGNALSVQQLGTGNVATFRTTTGATALFVGANGNVGIGTTNPAGALSVSSGGTLNHVYPKYLGNAGDTDTSYVLILKTTEGGVFFGTVSGIRNNSGNRSGTSCDIVANVASDLRVDANLIIRSSENRTVIRLVTLTYSGVGYLALELDPVGSSGWSGGVYVEGSCRYNAIDNVLLVPSASVTSVTAFFSSGESYTSFNSARTEIFSNTASGNALSVQQLGTGNVASFRTTTGATALFVNAAGNVGVGTTSVTTTGLQIGGTGVTGNVLQIGNFTFQMVSYQGLFGAGTVTYTPSGSGIFVAYFASDTLVFTSTFTPSGQYSAVTTYLNSASLTGNAGLGQLSLSTAGNGVLTATFKGTGDTMRVFRMAF